jgi:hypothetical protein
VHQPEIRARYDNPMGIAHKIYLVHALAEGKGIQILIDGTESVFEMLAPEYKLILGRLRFMGWIEIRTNSACS